MGLLVHDAINFTTSNIGIPKPILNKAENGRGQNEVHEEFYKLMEDAKVELYPDCKTFTRPRFIVILFHIKGSTKCTDKSFSMLLNAL